MWIFLGVIVAFLFWYILKLSIVSLYVLLFVGIVLGVALMAMRRRERHR